jgi:hypothetical protein
VPTESEVCGYSMWKTSPKELSALWKRVKSGRGLGKDRVSTDMMMRGGAVVNLAIAQLYNMVAEEPSRTPRDWKCATAVGTYKGKSKSREKRKSFRWVMNTTNLGKGYELQLLHRSELMVMGHEGQAVANKGIDSRHALYFIAETVAERSSQGLTTTATILDVETAFPAQQAELAILAMHARGARGGTLASMDGLVKEVQVRLTVANGKTTEPATIGIGLLEGSRLSPLEFVTAAADLIDEVGQQSLTVGGVEGGGASMFMDDLVGLTAETKAAAEVIHAALGWGYVARHSFNIDEKLIVGLLGRREIVEAARPADINVAYWPKEEGVEEERVKAATEVKRIPVVKSGITVLRFQLAEGAQLRIMMIMAAEAIRETERASHEARATMKVGQGL